MGKWLKQLGEGFARLLACLVLLLVSPAAVLAQRHDHLALLARIDPDAGTIRADAEISFPPVAAGDEINLVLGPRFQIDSADAGAGAEVSLRSTDKPWGPLQQIRVRFLRADQRPQLRLRYSGRPNPGGDLPINMVSPRLTELSLDGMWVPIRQDLDGRFSADARITGLPRDAIVTGQGRVSRQRDTVRIVRQAPGLDLPIIAAPGLRRVRTPAFEFLARNPESPRATLYREHAPRAIAWLSKWLGPLPGAPVRLVMVERERKSGYARPGYVVVTDSGSGRPEGIAKFVGHEFAHAWFTNANASGEHRWLDEGTAEYAGLRYVEEAFGRAARDEVLARHRELARDAGPVIGRHRPDKAIYSKGAVLLFELEERIGRDAVERVLARSVREKVADTADFLKIVEEVGGAEASAWMSGQLRG